MDLRRLRPGEWLALAGALVLAASLATTWYSGAAGDRSAWEAFGVVDWLLVLVALAGVVLAVLTAARESPALPVTAAVMAVVVAFPVVVTLLYRLLDPPGDGADPQLGAFAGLAGTLAVLAGAWLALRDETGGAERTFRAPVRERPAPPAGA